MLSLRVLQILLPVAFALQSLALPSEGSTFSLPLTPIGAHHGRMKPRGPVSLNYQQGGYVATITVGNQAMQALIDTGSPLLVVRREDYDPTKSSAEKDLGHQRPYHYGDGSGGTVHMWSDDVTIPGFGPTIKQVAVGRMLESAEQSQLPFGVLGLGHWDSTEYNSSELSLLDSMTKQKLLSRAEFTLDLSPGGGNLIFNDPNVKSYVYHTTQNHHGVDTIQASTSGMTSRAVIDSGTTQIIMPADDFKKFAKAHGLTVNEDPNDPLDGYYVTGDCSSDPKISFTFEQQTIKIPPKMFWQKYGSQSSSNCIGRIVGVGTDLLEGFWVLGGPFFHSAKVNFANGKIGLAPK